MCERAVSTGRLSLLEGEQLKFVAYRGEAFKHNAEFLEPLITQDSDDGPMGTAFSGEPERRGARKTPTMRCACIGRPPMASG